MTEPKDSNRPEHGLAEDELKDQAQESEQMDPEQGPQDRDDESGRTD